MKPLYCPKCKKRRSNTDYYGCHNCGKIFSYPKKICFYRKLDKEGHTEDIFIKRRIFLQNVKKFNDPFEFVMDRIPVVNLKSSKRKITEEDLKKELFVKCFSEISTKKNVLMWSHYADDHKGICIEYTPQYDLDINKTDYTDYCIFNLIEPVRYRIAPFKKGARHKDIHYVKEVLFTKAKCWEYEKEWRLNRSIGRDKYLEYEKEKLFLKFKPNELTKVTLGYRLIDMDDIKMIKNWIKKLGNQNIKIEKCDRSENKYQLKFTPLS